MVPINKQILVRKCTTGTRETHEGREYFRVGDIVVPNVRGEYQLWAEIIGVAEDCTLFTKSDIGGFVHLKEWSPQYIRAVKREEEFVVREELFTTGSVPAAVWR